MKESFFRTFVRTALKAQFKAGDNVPILRTPIINIFGSKVSELNNMSRLERWFEHGWYVFAAGITGCMTLIGLVIMTQPETLGKLGVFGTVALVLIWLFSVIQFLSLLGYFRFRLKK